MSLQGLISGSECALPNNPLAQVLKHTDSDHSLQRDRIAGPSSSRLQHLPPTSVNHVSESDASMARQFFAARGPDTQNGIQPNQGQMLELAHRMQMTSIGPAQQMPPQFQQNPELQDLWNRAELGKFLGNGPQTNQPASSSWTAEFGKSLSKQSVSDQAGVTQAYSSQQVNSFTPTSLYRTMGYGSTGMYNSTFPQTFAPIQDQGKGKGKGKAHDEAFEAAFAQFASELPSQTSSAELEELPDGANASSISQETQRHEAAPNGLDEFMRRFREDTQRLDPDGGANNAEWEAELQRYLQAEREDVNLNDIDYGAPLREAWESGIGESDDGLMPQGMKFDDEGVPLLDAYSFDMENKYSASPDSPSCLAQAKSLLQNNGSLTEAALLLEAAIQKGELGEGGYEAWILLGETRCMDEREEAGMRALTEGIRRAEEAGAKGVGLMSLASAFTNEGYERGSHAMLLRWLRARYPEHAPSEEQASTWLRQSHWASREHVTDAFLAVARAQHASGIVDAEVQIGLGVLFYTNGDFDRSKDCFSAALAVNPRDYLLWNRYGSALSNGGKPEEALGAYREALQLRPTYTRAIYNVGVACLSIGADKEAAEHFLSALSMQESPSGDKSEQLWFTLRRALIQMGREDLASRAHIGGDVAAFRSEGFDF